MSGLASAGASTSRDRAAGRAASRSETTRLVSSPTEAIIDRDAVDYAERPAIGKSTGPEFHGCIVRRHRVRTAAEREIEQCGEREGIALLGLECRNVNTLPRILGGDEVADFPGAVTGMHSARGGERRTQSIEPEVSQHDGAGIGGP